MISLGANNWNLALLNACLGGHRDMVEVFIQMGAKNWNSGLSCALEGGHFEIADYMLQLGADKEILIFYYIHGNRKVKKYVYKKIKQYNLDKDDNDVVDNRSKKMIKNILKYKQDRMSTF